MGVDVLPAQPPRGVSTIQGDFLSPAIQAEVRAYVSDPDQGRPRSRQPWTPRSDHSSDEDGGLGQSPTLEPEPSYIELERHARPDASSESSYEVYHERGKLSEDASEHMTRAQPDRAASRVVDVVLSDMCEPWEQTSGFGKKSISDPYRRMMNTSGTPFRDHAGSMVSAVYLQLAEPRLTIGVEGSVCSCIGFLLRHITLRRTFCHEVLSGC